MKEEKGGKKGVEGSKKGNKESNRREEGKEERGKTESGVLSFKDQRKHGGIYLITMLRILVESLPLLKKIVGYQDVKDEAIPTVITEFVPSRTDQEMTSD